ncbi:hypothetical protein [Vibrio metoecus]|uniref:hypothetical protein n=1 Tax=Vibrio metoecus TaxID=1481663 RepID=UPI000BA99213|nr:hypothetical protein [Vibrio metoecus]PAR27258.1 hypothetical protein CGU00_14785 [Vibrio metoecus]PAR60212.1 hypothetical protein CGT90_17265 [Vibrio metoecus]
MKSKELLSEVEQEIARTKAPSVLRLFLMLAKVITKECAELRQELNKLREFVNSPDVNDLNRHV